MKLFKNYKKLYKIELNNRKMYEERKKATDEHNAELQKIILKADKEVKNLKAEVAKLIIELEDTRGFLEQETQAKEALKKERTKLKTKLTRCINVLANYSMDDAKKFKPTEKDGKNGN